MTRLQTAGARRSPRPYTVVHDSFARESSAGGAGFAKVAEDVSPPGLPFVGESRRAAEFLSEIRRAAACDLPVLFLGASGSGKSLAARTVHSLSARGAGPFFDVNVSAVPDCVAESELFGTSEGAFTDAREREGYFSRADGGSVFLDEIGDASPSMQRRLLSVVETGEFRRVGSPDSERVDVRPMFATNADIRSMVGRGEFRGDLFYRIAGVVIECPPLSEMREDIPAFCRFHLGRRRCRKRLSGAAERLLAAFDWPGNYRQLQNALDRAAVYADGDEIRAEDIRIW